MNKTELIAALDASESKVETLEAELRTARDLVAYGQTKYKEALELLESEREQSLNEQRFLVQCIHWLSKPRRD